MLLEQLLDGGPGGSVGRSSADDVESSLNSEPVEYLLDREPDERADGAVYVLLTGRPGGSVARASVRDAGCWAGSFDTSARVCTTCSTSREGPFFKPMRFARRSAWRFARRLARRRSRSARSARRSVRCRKMQRQPSMRSRTAATSKARRGDHVGSMPPDSGACGGLGGGGVEGNATVRRSGSHCTGQATPRVEDRASEHIACG